jgi:hypothetical protein
MGQSGRDGSTPTYDNFTVEYVHFEGGGGVDSSLPPSMSTPVPEPLPTSAPRSPATTSAVRRGRETRGMACRDAVGDGRS